MARILETHQATAYDPVEGRYVDDARVIVMRANASPALTALSLGAFVFNKARQQARERGTFQAARNLRKQGVPLHLAVAILAKR